MPKKTSREGMTVVITGASSGIGKGVARQMADEGANVVLAARRTGLIEALAEELGPRAIAVTTDVSNEQDIAHLFEQALEAFGKIDVWINNAGIGAIGPFTDIPTEDLKRVIEVNVKGTINGSHFALRHFKETGQGILINLGSVTSEIAFPYYTGYSAAKHAVAGLSAALNEEMKLEGFENIHVCNVMPWATDTPWFIHTGNYTGHAAEMKPMDDPQLVIDAIVGLLDNPKESVAVGAKSKASVLSSHLMPGTTESLNAKFVQKVIEDAPHMEPNSGSLYEPMKAGTEVEGGIRERMKREEHS
ncbi:SDR family NAD(P)-dependent oxidoreductase [Planococcus sp. 1R117A]|uniref:SDR family NAD(P)-dependent oxidoreductase n=1 Tax=Planococcus sp. 1R117A TaxID=3447020 RepID=UPI003EDC18DC